VAVDGRPTTGRTAPAAASSWAPQLPQNTSLGSWAAPHEGQAAASGVPQLTQNLRPGLFSVAQFVQITGALS
jgi:hypothetical protein